MTCRSCRRRYKAGTSKCPHCGEANPDAGSGVFQTSTVLISSGGADLVYRSVDEVPAPLRSRLLKSTNGANSATILIADRRGREQIARAMRTLPGPVQRKLMQAILGSAEMTGVLRLTRNRRIALAVALLSAIAAIAWFVFAHH